MLYRAYCKDTGEIWESECFRNVYHCSMYSVKGYCHDHDGCSLIHITKCEALAEWKDSDGYLHCIPVDEEEVCLIAVNSCGYTIDYGSCVLEVNKDVWSMWVTK